MNRAESSSKQPCYGIRMLGSAHGIEEAQPDMANTPSEIVCTGCRMLIPLPAGRATPRHCPHCLAELPVPKPKNAAIRRNPVTGLPVGALLLGITAFGAVCSLLLLLVTWKSRGSDKVATSGQPALAPELLGQLEERDRLAKSEADRQKALKAALDKARGIKPTDGGALEAWRAVALAAEMPSDSLDQLIAAARATGEKSALEGDLKKRQEKDKIDNEKRNTLISEALAKGKAALDKGDSAQARLNLERARSLAPDTPGLEAEMAQLLKLENRQFEIAHSQTRLKAGQENLKAERWGEALRDFQAVLAVLPDNPEALQGKKSAEEGFDRLEKDREKRLQYLIHLDDGRKALKDRRYDDASAAFTRAARLMPQEKEAERLQEVVRQTRHEAERNSQAMVTAAKNLMSKGNPQEAFFLLVDADSLTPNDRTIRKLMSDAQQLVNRMQGIANPLSNDPKYLGYMAQGRAAMAAGNPIAAVECFENALRQTNSRDSFALRALMDARSAKDRLGQRATDYEKALRQGTLLMGRKEYGPAAFMLEGAVRLFPEQKTIELLEEAKFQDLVTRARDAVERDPDTAEKLADQALRLRPTDISASNIIKQAKAKALALANPKANPVDPYESAMSVGRNAMREKKFGEAVQAFRLALENKPNDQVAMELEKQARQRLVGQDAPKGSNQKTEGDTDPGKPN